MQEQDERMKKADEMEQTIIEGLGEAGALQAICAALSMTEKETIYREIIRVYELSADSEES